MQFGRYGRKYGISETIAQIVVSYAIIKLANTPYLQKTSCVSMLLLYFFQSCKDHILS